jgi:hypothetical protein
LIDDYGLSWWNFLHLLLGVTLKLDTPLTFLLRQRQLHHLEQLIFILFRFLWLYLRLAFFQLIVELNLRRSPFAKFWQRFVE